MGVDVKDIQILMLRFLKFSMNTCCRLVHKYPCSSGVLLFLFILYLFLPSVFYFLIYSFPFVLCTAVFLYFYLGLHHPNIANFLKDDKEGNTISSVNFKSHEADLDGNGDENSSTHSQRTLQRNVNQKSEESDLQGAKEEKVMVSSTTLKNHMIDGNILHDEKPGVSIEEKASSSLDRGESSSHNVSVGEDLAALGGASSSSDDEEDEGAQGGHGNKAVEWTENDQKNLMDLGISELERNRRLESLIARRRARKSMKLCADKNQIKTDYNPPEKMANLLVAKSNPFHVQSGQEEQIPGSAPSVLLPNRNPFDIPYDSNEEKPDLTADSFHQEFIAPQQKDTFFCRHQSFFLGHSFPLEGTEDQHGGGSGYPLFKRQLGKGDHDLLVDNLFLQGGESLRHAVTATNVDTEGQYPNQLTEIPEKDGENRCERIENADYIDSGSGHESEIETEIKAIKPSKSRSSLSYSSEDNKQVFNSDRREVAENQQPTAFQFPDTLHRVTPNTIPFPFPKARSVCEPSYDSSISAIDKARKQDQLFYGKKEHCYTPTNSIASDLQVEVSEVGSPPLTVDGTASSIDGESLTYDGDIEKEITSGSDEMWGVSPHAPRDHEITPIESNGHNSITEGEIPSIGKEPEDPVPLTMESLSSSRTEIPQEEKDHSVNIDNKIPNDVQAIFPPKSSSEGSDSMEGSMTQTFLDKPQESLNPPEDPAEELNIEYKADNTEASSPNLKDLASTEDRNVGIEDRNVGEVIGELSKPVEYSNLAPSKYVGDKELDTPERSIEEVNHYMEDLKVIEERDGETEKSMKREVELDPAKLAAESASESVKYAEIHSSQHIANLAISESAKPTEESKNPKGFEDPERKLAESEHLMKNLISTQERKEEESAAEVGVSGLSQSFNNDPTTSAILPQSETEPVSTNPSTSSSPRSVLPDSIPTSEAPLAYATQTIHTNISESDMNESRNRLLDQPTPENVVLTAPQVAQQVADNSTDRADVNANSERSEYQYSPLQNSTAKVDTVVDDILGENEDESQRLDGQKEIIESSNSTAVDSSDSIVTNEGEPKELNKDEANHMETSEEIKDPLVE